MHTKPLSTICFTELGDIFFTERSRIAFFAYYPCNAAVKFGQKEGILVDRIIKLPTFRNNLHRQCTIGFGTELYSWRHQKVFTNCVIL